MQWHMDTMKQNSFPLPGDSSDSCDDSKIPHCHLIKSLKSNTFEQTSDSSDSSFNFLDRKQKYIYLRHRYKNYKTVEINLKSQSLPPPNPWKSYCYWIYRVTTQKFLSPKLSLLSLKIIPLKGGESQWTKNNIYGKESTLLLFQMVSNAE